MVEQESTKESVKMETNANSESEKNDSAQGSTSFYSIRIYRFVKQIFCFLFKISKKLLELFRTLFQFLKFLVR